jgi:hypothetical protein
VSSALGKTFLENFDEILIKDNQAALITSAKFAPKNAHSCACFCQQGPGSEKLKKLYRSSLLMK